MLMQNIKLHAQNNAVQDNFTTDQLTGQRHDARIQVLPKHTKIWYAVLSLVVPSLCSQYMSHLDSCCNKHLLGIQEVHEALQRQRNTSEHEQRIDSFNNPEPGNHRPLHIVDNDANLSRYNRLIGQYKVARWQKESLLRAYTVYKCLSVLNFIWFLKEGIYRNIVERIVKVTCIAINPTLQRQVSFDFMNNNLYWRTLTEFALTVFPFVDIKAAHVMIHKLIRQLMRLIRSGLKKTITALSHLQRDPLSMAEGNSCQKDTKTVYLQTVNNFRYYVIKFAQMMLWKLTTDAVKTFDEQSAEVISTAKCAFCNSFPIVCAHVCRCRHPFCYVCGYEALKLYGKECNCPTCGEQMSVSQFKRLRISY